jgi:hypothetical protein
MARLPLEAKRAAVDDYVTAHACLDTGSVSRLLKFGL